MPLKKSALSIFYYVETVKQRILFGDPTKFLNNKINIRIKKLQRNKNLNKSKKIQKNRKLENKS